LVHGFTGNGVSVTWSSMWCQPLGFDTAWEWQEVGSPVAWCWSEVNILGRWSHCHVQEGEIKGPELPPYTVQNLRTAQSHFHCGGSLNSLNLTLLTSNVWPTFVTSFFTILQIYLIIGQPWIFHICVNGMGVTVAECMWSILMCTEQCELQAPKLLHIPNTTNINKNVSILNKLNFIFVFGTLWCFPFFKTYLWLEMSCHSSTKSSLQSTRLNTVQ